MRYFFLSTLFLFLVHAQDPKIEKLAPYYPTPQIVVEKMLELGGLKPGEKMFDLGSGDGRIVITAAQSNRGPTCSRNVLGPLGQQLGLARSGRLHDQPTVGTVRTL